MYPLPSKSPEIKQLYATTAIGARPANRECFDILPKAHLDIVAGGSSQGNSVVQVVAREQATALIAAGADALMVCASEWAHGSSASRSRSWLRATAVDAVSEFTGYRGRGISDVGGAHHEGARAGSGSGSGGIAVDRMRASG